MDKSGFKIVLQKLELAQAHVKEHGLEPFLQLSQENPSEAIKQFPDFLDNILSASGNFFRGLGCGGPYPGATVPLLNTIGAIYPPLVKPIKKKALLRVFDFLDRQNYFLAQENVEHIQEPSLLRDILINRALYWPGIEDYKNRLKGVNTSQEFEDEFFGEGKRIASIGLLGYAITRINLGYDSKRVRKFFYGHFPEISDRVLDFTAGLTETIARCSDVEEGEEKISYNHCLEIELNKYAPELRKSITKKIKENKWIWLPETLNKMKMKE